MIVRKPQRNTRQRQVILEELRKLTSHPTAGKLYEIVRGRLPKVSLGTVYRNLELLARMGVIQKIELGGGEARFDGCVALHHHVQCVECGRVDDIRGVVAQPVDTMIKDCDGYEILDYRLKFIGVCAPCGRKRPAKEHGTYKDD